MKLKQLIKKLKAKSKVENPEIQFVQFVICRMDGKILGMSLKKENVDLDTIAKLFAKKKNMFHCPNCQTPWENERDASTCSCLEN